MSETGASPIPGTACVPANAADIALRRPQRSRKKVKGTGDDSLCRYLLFFVIFLGISNSFLLHPERNQNINILLVTMDTTRADRVGAYGYRPALTPSIDGLAAGGVMFETAYSPVPITLPAHCSIMTGTYPPFHRVRNNGKYFLPPQAITLAELLKAKGFATAAFVSSFILDSRFGLAQGFDLYDDRVGGNEKIRNFESERRAPETVAAFGRWFTANPNRRFFVWVHFFDPHAPYDPPEPFRSDKRIPTPYDGEIACMDAAIGRIVGLLKQKGIFERTLIVLVGDHGEAFGEHGEYGHTIFCYNENLRVPLILCGPGIAHGRRVAAPASLIDVTPTLLDLAGVSKPGFIQGQSLLPAINGKSGTAGRPLYFESLYAMEVMGCAPLTGLVREEWKYIELPKAEMYDLKSDRAEKANLFLQKNVQGRKLKDQLNSFEKIIGRSDFTSIRRMSDEERKKLETLGYFSAAKKHAVGASASDPKDWIGFWNRTIAVKKLLASGKLAEAEKELLALRTIDPDFTPVIEDLAQVYLRQKRIDSLTALFDKALLRNPKNSALRITYAYQLMRLRRPDRAIVQLKRAEGVADFDEREQIYFVLGSACGMAGRYTDAIPSFRKVLEINPENFEAAKRLALTLYTVKRFREALLFYEKAEKGLAGDAQLFDEIALTHAALKEFGSAFAYFEKAVKLAPTARIYADYAVTVAATGDYTRAVILMEKALSDPKADTPFLNDARKLIARWRKTLKSKR